jgi:general secretion pathway protein D
MITSAAMKLSRIVVANAKGPTGKLLLALFVTVAIGGCTSNRFANRSPAWSDRLQGPEETATATTLPSQQRISPQPAVGDTSSSQTADFYRPGSDMVIRKPESIADAREQSDGDVKLNFQNANLLEVVKVILGDMLQINYVIDPEVQGTVSMQSTRALRREDLIPTLELMLRMNNAALVTTDGIYRIVPLPRALAEVRASQLGDSSMALPAGFSIRIVPLRYVAAEEMAQILGPIVAGGNQLLRVDTARNLLVLASAGTDMDRLLETIEVFDVDQMSGMSVALFTPDFVDASTLAGDLEDLLADPEHGLMRGLVRFIVVERLNGLMVVTPRAEHLARVREWIRRLDRNTGDASPRLFIYRVQNGKAADLAEVLNELFSAREEDFRQKAELAPGLEPTTIGQPPDAAEPSERNVPIVQPFAAGEGLAIERNEQVQVIADEPNNALLILARGNEYRQILAALRQLDVSPLQVLIEVTIAEVSLTDNLSFGVEWFFRNNFADSYSGIGRLDLGGAGIGALQPGFSYALQGGDGVVRAVLNTLATETNLSIIQSPSLLVLNNQEATIQVGDEVPVATSQQQSVIGDSPLINTIEYRDTGIVLRVKPRVNSGGLVIMDVEQEASNVPFANNLNPLTPRIQQRKISSTVAVNSGDTIILGGLIQNDRDTSESGVPLIHKVPFLGALFGSKEDNQSRTELIVLITPRAVSNSTAALQVTDEYRRRLKKLIPSRKPNDTGYRKDIDAQPETVTSRTTAAAVPVSRVEPAAPKSDKTGGWVVQVGSFRDEARANEVVEQLRRASIATPAPEQIEIGGDTYYSVFVPTGDRQNGETIILRIDEVTNLKGVLIQQP